jgi:hypothetical protein
MRTIEETRGAPGADDRTVLRADAGAAHLADDWAEDGADDWATQTRRVLTRDLLLRAARAQPGESRALQFRALHLNLPLIGEVADRLGLTGLERTRIEHAALDGLAQALGVYDPCGTDDFVTVAVPMVEREIGRLLPTPPVSRRRGPAARR